MSIHQDAGLCHQGYMDGLSGNEPNPEKKRDDYELGWLAGAEDREAGNRPDPFLGPVKDHPFKRGDVVKVPKGTPIHSMNPGKGRYTAKTTHKVTLHDVNQGSPAYVDWSTKNVKRPTVAEVLWAGSGGYWCYASIKDVVSVTQPLRRQLMTKNHESRLPTTPITGR